MHLVAGFLLALALPQQETTEGVVGQAVCQTCHAETHASWASSRHSKMVQPATVTSVQGDFADEWVELRGKGYGLKEENGTFYISEDYLGPERTEREVQYTLGNRRIQHYLTTLDDGRIIVLPPSWDILRQEWFHNLEIAAPDQKEDSDAVIVQVWNKNCFGCHVSEEVKKYDQTDRRYATEWLDFGGNCERCHGPGDEHVAKYTSANPTTGVDTNIVVPRTGVDTNINVPRTGGATNIVVPTKLDNVRNSQVCAQCHSFRDIMKFGFTAGDDYFDYFFPLLEYGMAESADPTWWPDGKTRRFSTNALAIWQSECFLEGRVACTNCHVDTHEPEIERNPQLAATNRELCTTCHESIGADIEAHTFHPAASDGSSCVECHMPRSVTSIKATMRDHSISIPVPENTTDFGVPNACNLCHEDQSPEWAAATLDRWYPGSTARDKVRRRAQAFTAARNRAPGATELLLSLYADKGQGPIPRANAVGYLGGIDDPRAFPTLVGALEDDHPLIRATAALKLGERAGANEVAAKMKLEQAILDEKRIVRMNAAISLLNLGVQKLAGEAGQRFEEAKADHVARGAFHADDAPQQLNLGRFHVLRGASDAAAATFENSFALNPDQPGIKFFMAVTRLTQSRTAEARDLLEAVADDDPFAGPARELLEKLPRP